MTDIEFDPEGNPAYERAETDGDYTEWRLRCVDIDGHSVPAGHNPAHLQKVYDVVDNDGPCTLDHIVSEADTGESRETVEDLVRVLLRAQALSETPDWKFQTAIAP